MSIAANFLDDAAVKRIPSSGAGCQLEFVLWHGWGLSSVIWRGWIAELSACGNVTLIDLPGYGLNPDDSYRDVEQLLSHYADSLPERAVHVGYSLGGMLAMQFAFHYPSRVAALVTLASNQRFVASHEYSSAMAADTFSSFRKSLVDNKEKALARFSGLQSMGASNAKQQLSDLKTICQQDQLSHKGLQQSLQLLESIDVSSSTNKWSCPSLHLFADNDVLVPAGAAKHFADNKKAVNKVLSGASHYSLVANKETSLQHIYDFLTSVGLMDVGETIRKDAIAHSFSQAAHTYDDVAQLQNEVALDLLEKITTRTIDRCIDLGCGTGYITEQLEDKVAEEVVAIDIAKGMIDFAKAQRQTTKTQWLCADFEHIPMPSRSVDMIFSSLAMQWCQQLDCLFEELRRVLVDGGEVYFSTLGPNTLSELREAWRGVDDYVHVNPFASQENLRAAFTAAGFVECGFESKQRIMEYPALQDFTHSLKALGAHNLNANRPKGLMGKQRMKTFKSRYESFRNDNGLLPATYEVWFWHLQAGKQ